jgi:hypothetical protein
MVTKRLQCPTAQSLWTTTLGTTPTLPQWDAPCLPQSTRCLFQRVRVRMGVAWRVVMCAKGCALKYACVRMQRGVH